jgi:undecaprenyl-diphosphatase
MTGEFIFDLGKLLLIIYCIRWGIRTYVQLRQPTGSAPLAKRRLTVLVILVLGVLTVKLIEDVLDDESGVVDKAVLLFVHTYTPHQLTGFFEWITYTGSSTFLLVLTPVSTVALLLVKRRFDALLLLVSVSGAAAVVYLVKLAVQRVRPALWDTQWYWGSSFPSGHTLVVAAFATAMALIASRAWPATRALAVTIAVTWIGLVALSRLVLGVHWPTDVLAAACIGASFPLALSITQDLVALPHRSRLHDT